LPNVLTDRFFRSVFCLGISLGESETYTLSRIEGAIRTLSAAVDRLEAAAATRVSTGDLLLAGELRDVREDCARLEDTNRVIGSRLDGAIERLRAVLEE
jgi:hypothetical protein